jgi:hypothetical protein
MKKMSLSLLAAGVMAAAGLAHADAIFYPDGTVMELGPTGADNLALTSSDSLTVTADNAMVSDTSDTSDTSVLGAGPATITSTTATTVTPVVDYVYVQPNINWDRSVAVDQLHHNYHLMHRGDAQVRHQAAATFNTPARAGEASTMTGGAPNMVTDNQAIVVGSYNIPYSTVTTDGPYYVFSY